jgi:hypothetical protein
MGRQIGLPSRLGNGLLMTRLSTDYSARRFVCDPGARCRKAAGRGTGIPPLRASPRAGKPGEHKPRAQ